MRSIISGIRKSYLDYLILGLGILIALQPSISTHRVIKIPYVSPGSFIVCQSFSNVVCSFGKANFLTGLKSAIDCIGFKSVDCFYSLYFWSYFGRLSMLIAVRTSPGVPCFYLFYESGVKSGSSSVYWIGRQGSVSSVDVCSCS